MNGWDELDAAARANLGDRRFPEFARYRDQLQSEGLDWAEAKEILAGWIWGELEEPDSGTP